MQFNRLSEIQRRYYDRRHAILKAAIGFMALLAVTRIAYQIWRLVLEQGKNGALDLRLFHGWTIRWFEGDPIKDYIFLPATYPVLWTLTGWLSYGASRWLWLALYAVSIVWLVHIVRSETGLRSGKETALVTLFILAIYPTGITIGNGQLILFTLPALLTAVLICRNGIRTPRREITASVLLLFSTVKLPVAAPFFLIILISQKAFRTILIVAAAYIFLTLLALSFRDMDIIQYISVWAEDSSKIVTRGGYANIHHFLGPFGMKYLLLPSSLILLTAMGLWVYKYSKTDIWIQLGVMALIARLWAYHRLYDDLLILIPMVAVFRLLRSGELSKNQERAAGLIFALTCLGLLSPGSFLQLPPPLGTLFRTGQTFIWLSMLAFLLYHSYKASKAVRTESV